MPRFLGDAFLKGSNPFEGTSTVFLTSLNSILLGDTFSGGMFSGEVDRLAVKNTSEFVFLGISYYKM